MPVLSVRRRVGKLESSGIFFSPVDYPPLTSAEVQDFATRVQMGRRFSRQELDRLQQHSPVLDGEVLMTAHRGKVFVKRYPGMNVADF